MDGAPRRIRTADPFITNEVLYQLSYWGIARLLTSRCDLFKTPIEPGKIIVTRRIGVA